MATKMRGLKLALAMFWSALGDTRMSTEMRGVNLHFALSTPHQLIGGVSHV